MDYNTLVTATLILWLLFTGAASLLAVRYVNSQ